MSRPFDPRLLRAMPALRSFVASVALLQAIGALLIVMQAGLLANVVSEIFLRHRSLHSITSALVALAAVGLARAVLGAVQEWVAATTSVRVRAQLRSRVLHAVARMGPVAAARHDPGRLATAAGAGLESLDPYVTRALPALLAGMIVPPVMVARIGWADWQSAALLLVVLPLVPLFMALVGLMTRRFTERQYATLARMSGHFLDLVRGLPTLKIYGQSKRQIATVQRATDTYRRHTMTALRMGFLSALVLDLLATLSVALVAVDVGLRLDHGSLSLSTALVVLFLTPELFAPLRAMGAQHHASEEGLTAARAALDVIASAPQRDTVSSRDVSSLSTGTVTARGLTVAYADRSMPALAGVDLEIGPGEVVAVQGRSGAGKSTLLAVLLGFAQPSRGSVTVGLADGTADLADVDVESWRDHVAWVPQRPHLTQQRVRDEVALGDPDADEARIADAIRACVAPDGRVLLGENAMSISAGQRRRVALARALLRAWREIDRGSVPIVLLDEPSEDLDRRTEQVVAHVIADLAGQATVLVATHSEHLARVASRRIELADGRVVADVRQHAVQVEPPAVDWPSQHYEPSPVAPEPSGGDVLGVRSMRRRLIVAGLLSGLAGLTGLALTATSVWLICRAAQHPNVQALAIAVVGVRTFALARALLRYAERLVSHDSALRLLARVRVQVFAALEPLVPFGVSDLRRGDLLRRFVTEVDAIQESMVRAVVPLAGAIVTTAGSIALAAAFVPTAGAILAGGVLVGLVVAPWCSRRIAGDGSAAAELAGRRDAASAAFVESLDELVAYSAADAAIGEIEEMDADVARQSRQPALAATAGVALTSTAAAATMPLVLATSATAVSSGAVAGVDVGVLVACVLVAFDVLAPLPSAFAAWARLQAGVRRVAVVLNRPSPMVEPVEPGRVPAGRTGLTAHDLALAPAPGAVDVVRGVDIAVRPGRRIALVGPSGSGKSTVLSALLRLNPPTHGEMTLDHDGDTTRLCDVRASDMAPLVAGSLQGDHVFDASIGDNLRVVRPNATDDDLLRVAGRVGLADFVTSLPAGWNTPAGADGAGLSGGQRQRLLLARVLLADPAVLVLDEPTAHLDADTEREVLDDLLRATRERTLVMTTHRAVDGDIDSVLTVEGGSVTELV